MPSEFSLKIEEAFYLQVDIYIYVLYTPAYVVQDDFFQNHFHIVHRYNFLLH